MPCFLPATCWWLALELELVGLGSFPLVQHMSLRRSQGCDSLSRLSWGSVNDCSRANDGCTWVRRSPSRAMLQGEPGPRCWGAWGALASLGWVGCLGWPGASPKGGFSSNPSPSVLQAE